MKVQSDHCPWAESLPHIVWRARPDGFVEYVNARGAAYAGVPAEGIQGWGWRTLIHPEDVGRAQAAWDQAARSGTPYETEYRLRRTDGAYRWQLVRALPDGSLQRWTGTCTDIDDQARAAQDRERLLARERQARVAGVAAQQARHHARLQLAIQAAGVGLWDWDLRTGALYFSPEYKRQLGCGEEELKEACDEWERRLHPDDRERITQRLEAYLAKPWPDYEAEYRLRHQDGSYRWMLTRAELVYDAQGTPCHMLGCHLDITERKQAEEAQRESEARFRQLADNIDEVFWLADARLQSILYVSPAYERIRGRTCESLRKDPRSFFEAIHPDDRARAIETFWVLLDAPTELEYRIVRPDGVVRWIRNRAFPVRDAAGHVIRIAGLAEDMTERRHLEMQLRQAQKMEAIGQLAGGVAHDFNNLLAVISGHSELLAAGSPADDQWHDSVAEIRRASQLAASSTRQLLAFSRRQILEPKLLDLNAVVSDAGKMLRRLIGEDVRLSTNLQPRLKPVRADRGQLDQMILNLALNARDAMPAGGTLTLETGEIDWDPACTETPLGVRPAHYVRLTVTDSGHGMTPEVQARVFEPFFTTKAEGRGTGLGLSVVHGIVQQSGGHVSVCSRPGAGTTFHIDLPAVPGTAESPVPNAPSNLPGGHETVLLVEDEAAVRNVTTRMLECLGYRVLEAANGEEAVPLFEARRADINLLMTDVVMPGLGGRGLAEALWARDAGLKVLFHSGYTDDTVVRGGILAAEVAFLQKPFTLEALARKVRDVLDRR
ncbi:MAG TPA: PAS domain-containing protein [Chthoniobacterales bacterium]